MEALAKLITAIATLAWPTVVMFMIFKFFDPVKALVESAKNRKFTIKVAGNELSMEEASEQQRAIISDLAQKVATLEQALLKSSTEFQTDISDSLKRNARRILWVDDRPKNNSLLVATLEEQGVKVDIALNTDEGIELSLKNKYDAIVSDMGRPEGDHAGIDFTQKIRDHDKTIPIYIFCGSWAARNLRAEALEAGVTEITSSGSTALRLLQKQNA